MSVVPLVSFLQPLMFQDARGFTGAKSKPFRDVVGFVVGASKFSLRQHIDFTLEPDASGEIRQIKRNKELEVVLACSFLAMYLS